MDKDIRRKRRKIDWKLAGSIVTIVIFASLCIGGIGYEAYKYFSGNRQFIDTKWTFTEARIDMGDKVIVTEVKSWKDYDDTSIQIVAKDGTVYLTDIKNVVLIGH